MADAVACSAGELQVCFIAPLRRYLAAVVPDSLSPSARPPPVTLCARRRGFPASVATEIIRLL